MKTIIITLITLITLSAFSIWFIGDRDRAMWTLNTAIKVSNPIETISHIQYGDNDWQYLDIYPQHKTAPVIVFIHGGTWRHGRKDQYRFVADAFYRLGYTVVIPDYVKYPRKEARYPSFAIDAAKALAWVKNNINQYNGDNTNVFLAGHSAGAHTVIMLSTDSQYLIAEGLSESDIRGVAGIAGPYSFTPDREVTKAVFGPQENYPLMNALNYVDGQEPPTLLLHSQDDTQVGVYNQEVLSASLEANNVDVVTVLYNGLNHINMVTHLHPWLSKHAHVANDIDSFFRQRAK